MVWIKRNLVFVLSAAVGVLLIAGAGYFFYDAMSKSSSAKEELSAAVSDLEGLQGKSPFPSKENVEIAKQQQQQVKDLLAEVKSSFVPVPAPPKTDERGFKSVLDKSIARMQDSAMKAGVGLPSQFAFGFSTITAKLNFPAENIEPWSSQLQEVELICGVLFRAKINYLETIRRVPVGTEEQMGPELLSTNAVTNQLCISIPYEVTFKTFSGEIAALLNEFQHASNCFVVKNIDVQPYTGTPGDAATTYNAPAMRVATRVPVGQAGGVPVTVLSEKPLRVTLVVEVNNLKTQ